MKVLVIEDDRMVGQFVQRGLEEQRVNVDLVADGAEGLERASHGEYDVIVLDLRLPRLAGQEVLRTLRDRGVATPVLVLTAQDAVESKVQALRTGISNIGNKTADALRKSPNDWVESTKAALREAAKDEALLLLDDKSRQRFHDLGDAALDVMIRKIVDDRETVQQLL